MAIDAPKIIHLPDGLGDRKFINFSAPNGAQLVHTLNRDGEQVTEVIGQVPSHARYIYVQHRMAGDWYCEIEGSRHVAAIAPDRVGAARAVLARLAA